MIGENGMRGVIEETGAFVIQSRVGLSINGKPLLKEENPDEIFYSKVTFFLRYKPSANVSRRKQPFIVSCDLFKCDTNKDNVRIADYNELVAKSKKVKSIAWFLKHTKISPKHFEIAKNNPGCFIAIGFDLAEYFEMIGDPQCVCKHPDLCEIERIRTRYHLEQYGITDVEV